MKSELSIVRNKNYSLFKHKTEWRNMIVRDITDTLLKTYRFPSKDKFHEPRKIQHNINLYT